MLFLILQRQNDQGFDYKLNQNSLSHSQTLVPKTNRLHNFFAGFNVTTSNQKYIK